MNRLMGAQSGGLTCKASCVCPPLNKVAEPHLHVTICTGNGPCYHSAVQLAQLSPQNLIGRYACPIIVTSAYLPLFMQLNISKLVGCLQITAAY